MVKRYLLLTFLTITLSTSWYILSSGTEGVLGVYYSSGPASSGLDRTGGPLSGGQTCSACHSGGSGSTSISFVLKNSSNVAVTSYIAGATYTAEFQVTSTLASKGFQAVALKSGNTQAGSFTTAITTQSQISTLSGKQYPEHQGASSTGLFKFTWVAPIAGSGNVTFYSCGNGVNGNGGTSGDLSSTAISNVITEVPPTTISYGVTQACNNSSNLTATITGTSGGTFSALPSGLSINGTTGEINVVGSSPGQYTVTYAFAGGSATKTIKINPLYNINNTATICSNDSILLGGAWQNSAGVYTSNLQSISGCDSIVNTTLSIKQTSSSSSMVTICEGDSILVGGQYISTPGLNTIVVTNAVGCDSTISTTLIVNPSYDNTITQTICQGESVTFNGSLITTSGLYVENSQTTLGCDSITTLNLTVTAVNVGVTNTGVVLTAQAVGADYQWLDCGNNYSVIAGATSQTYAATMNGDYAVRVTEQTCVDTSACELVVLWGLDENQLGGVTIFPNPSNGNLNMSFTNEIKGEFTLFDLNGAIIFSDNLEGVTYSKKFDLEPGTYIIQVKEKDKISQSLWVVE